jgi:dipeptidyl aminopeptidase/acylaminoacyl peptidase
VNGVAAPSQAWIPLDHPSGGWDDKPRWSPSGSVLYFLSDRDGFFCIWGQRMDTRNWHPIGAPFPVYHLHKSRLATANLGIVLSEIGVAKDKIVISLQQLTGNIWSLTRK